ncbi:FG-GAP repeat protein [Enterovibrio norvegicus]|uniref:FG-GAP repeat protein n=1 Tax=Enterovibrio norvegicus TaxID=188144 RepID=UPI003D0D2035
MLKIFKSPQYRSLSLSLALLIPQCSSESVPDIPSDTENNSPPSAFSVTSLTATENVAKRFVISWQESQYADNYTVCMVSDSSPGDCSSLGETSTESFSFYLQDRLLDQDFSIYVIATNQYGETESNTIITDASLRNTSVGLVIPPEAEDFDNSGAGVAISGDGQTAAIGRPGDDGLGNVGTDYGAVDIYRLNNDQWSYEDTLSCSIQKDNDTNGYVLDLNQDGNILAMGVPTENRAGRSETGAICIFEYSSTWSETSILRTNAAPSAFARTGDSLILSDDGNRVIAGLPGHGNQRGSAVALENDGGWSQTLFFVVPGTINNDRVGASISGNSAADRIVIGSPGDDSSQGSAYVYDLVGGTWTYIEKLISPEPDSDDQFGATVQMNGNGNIIAISSPNDDGPSNVNGTNNTGAVHIFEDQNGTWNHIQTLYPSQNTANLHFGGESSSTQISLSDDGDILVVGSPGQDLDVPATSSSNDGSTYIFRRQNGTYTSSVFTSPDNQPSDQFGSSVALSDDGGTLIIGAQGDDGALNTNDAIGSAYIY